MTRFLFKSMIKYNRQILERGLVRISMNDNGFFSHNPQWFVSMQKSRNKDMNTENTIITIYESRIANVNGLTQKPPAVR